MNVYKNFKNAFTLSEVLITIGILGVVAAISIPTVIANHQKQTYVTQLRKISYEIEQAGDLYMTDIGSNSIRNIAGNANKLREFMTTYFKISKDCGVKYTPCFAQEYYAMNGNDPVKTKYGICNVIVSLANGASICADSANMAPIENDDKTDVDHPFLNSSNKAGENGEVIAFEVDINGPKGPNIYGRDYFTFELYPNGSIKDKEFEKNGADFTTGNPGNGMYGKIVEDGWKMNY